VPALHSYARISKKKKVLSEFQGDCGRFRAALSAFAASFSLKTMIMTI